MIRKTPSRTDWVAVLDTTARAVRSGTAVSAAWVAAAPPALAHQVHDSELDVALRAIDAARSAGAQAAAIVQSAATVIRERRAAAHDAQVHSTYARTSARILTALPMLVFAFGVATNRSFRHTIGTPHGIVVALGGIALNLCGWWLINRATSRVGHRARTANAFIDSVELVALALRAGEVPSTAIAWVATHGALPIRPAFAAVTATFTNGARFAEALHELPVHLGAIAVPFTDALVAAELDGLPLAPMLERLTADARAERRRHYDTETRRLSVRLALPLTLCTLPAFTLLAIAPMVLAALDHLRT